MHKGKGKSIIKFINNNCKKTLFNMFSILIIGFFIKSLIACGGIGMTFSDRQEFHGNESMIIENPRYNILDIIADVGKSMGYNISGLNREHGYISLSSSTRMTSMMLIGKMNRADLRIFVAEDGTKLNIQYSVLGNFGAGDYEAATQLVEDFKSEMEKALRN